MIQDYPITPPASLVQTWVDSWYSAKVKHEELIACVARQAVNWGADQQLAEDAKWLDHNALNETHLKTIPVGDLLKEAMRPSP